MSIVSTKADPELYRASWGLVWASFLVPVFFLLFDVCRGHAEWFMRSGALTAFLAAVAQFKQLGLLQTKHVMNAQRAQEGDHIQNISHEYKSLEWTAFVAGLYGTLILAYGDILARYLTG